MINKNFLKLIPLCVAAIISCLPFNIIIGSRAAWFSYSSMAIPALGYQSSLLYVILFIFTKCLFSSHALVFYLLHRLPLVFATLALQKRSVTLFVLLPITTIILFSFHPVGQHVFYYAWYWFIPIIIYFFIKDSLCSRALASSFIAHAIGSVVWLYTGSISIQVWNALMPIVPIERVIIAAGMLAYIYLFEALVAISSYRVKA